MIKSFLINWDFHNSRVNDSDACNLNDEGKTKSFTSQTKGNDDLSTGKESQTHNGITNVTSISKYCLIKKQGKDTCVHL